MKLSNALQAFEDLAKQSDGYWIEHAKLGFAVAMEKRLRALGISYAELARRIGTSAAYISKVFRGDTNLTIETMVKLTRATGSDLEIRVVASGSNATHWAHTLTAPPCQAANQARYSPTGNTVAKSPYGLTNNQTAA